MTGDIFISKIEKNTWIEFDSSQDDLFDVDYVLTKYADFWDTLEVSCMAECCGFGAFSFYVEDIEKAVKKVDVQLIRADLLKLKQDLIESDKCIICSSNLNQLMDKTVFIKLLEHIIKNC